ncbi:MAG: N-acetylmuramic acid 6-phosphate etherase [Planctomycetota bacterium]
MEAARWRAATPWPRWPRSTSRTRRRSTRSRGPGLLYFGAGTSGRLGALDAAECPPTFGVPADRIVARIAGGERALVAAVEGAEDDRAAAVRDVDELGVDAPDLVVGITAGGTTPYVHAALARARERGATTIFLACVGADEVPDDAELSVRLVTGAELVAGSTRLKAGTATKLALNRLSTTALARLGHVAGGRMVDVATRANAKLWARAVDTLVAECALAPAAAEALLEAAGGGLKLAWAAAHLGVEPPEAARRLELVAGDLDALLAAD